MHSSLCRLGTIVNDGDRRSDLLFLGLLAVLLFSAGLGLRDAWIRDEARFALIAKEMVHSGTWLFPTRGGELYADKPPLFIWAIAVFYWLTGSIRIAGLLPSLIAGVVSVLLIYDLGSKLWTRCIGLYAGLTLVTVYQFTLQARIGQTDGMLCMWTTLALYGLMRHLLLGPAWGWYAAGFAAMGFGVVTKGVGFLPLLIFIPYSYARLRGWPGGLALTSRSWVSWLLGPLAMLAAIGTWLVPMLTTVALSGDPHLEAYRDNILWLQTSGRYTASWHHFRPFWYYFAYQMPALWLPVSLLLPWLLPTWWRCLRDHDTRFLLLLGWIILVLLFFSASAGKRGVYLLPVVPAFALAVAPLLPDLWQRVIIHRLAWLITLAVAGVLLATALACGGLVPECSAKLTERYPENLRYLLAGLGGLGLVYVSFLSMRRGILALCALTWTGWVLLGWWGYPILNLTNSYAPLMVSVNERIGPNSTFAFVDHRWREELLVHAGVPVTMFVPKRLMDNQYQKALQWLQVSDDRWLLTTEWVLERCFLRDGAIELDQRNQIRLFLVKRTAILSACKA